MIYEVFRRERAKHFLVFAVDVVALTNKMYKTILFIYLFTGFYINIYTFTVNVENRALAGTF